MSDNVLNEPKIVIHPLYRASGIDPRGWRDVRVEGQEVILPFDEDKFAAECGLFLSKFDKVDSRTDLLSGDDIEEIILSLLIGSVNEFADQQGIRMVGTGRECGPATGFSGEIKVGCRTYADAKRLKKALAAKTD